MPATESTNKPRQIKDVSIIFDPTGANVEFRKVLQSFQFVPQTQTSSTQGGTPDAIFTDTVLTGYQLQMKFLQDSESLGSLTDYLHQNKGTRKTVNFVPYGGTGWQATIVVPPAPIGGDFQSWISDTVTAGVIGVPTRIADDTTTTQQ